MPRPIKEGRLEQYVAKRDFDTTPEPQRSDPTATGDMFVVQKHRATQLHYDFCLEMPGRPPGAITL
jgi:bifunctional non-homologous end joining protein LigD